MHHACARFIHDACRTVHEHKSVCYLNAQDVWCKLILSGKKLEETRRYALPTELLGMPGRHARLSLALSSEWQPSLRLYS